MFVGDYHYDYEVFFANANDESMKNEIEQYERLRNGNVNKFIS